MENAVSNREAFKNELGYSRRNWDYLGRVNDELEYKAWSELTVNQTVALNFIGFHPDSHDFVMDIIYLMIGLISKMMRSTQMSRRHGNF